MDMEKWLEEADQDSVAPPHECVGVVFDSLPACKYCGEWLIDEPV